MLTIPIITVLIIGIVKELGTVFFVGSRKIGDLEELGFAFRFPQKQKEREF